jgi:hypothetical protein
MPTLVLSGKTKHCSHMIYLNMVPFSWALWSGQSESFPVLLGCVVPELFVVVVSAILVGPIVSG